MDTHDKWNLRYDEADKVQTALRAVKLLGTAVPAGLLEKLASFLSDETTKKDVEDFTGKAFKFKSQITKVLSANYEECSKPSRKKTQQKRRALNCIPKLL